MPCFRYNYCCLHNLLIDTYNNGKGTGVAVVAVVVVIYCILSRLLYLAFSANLGHCNV